MAEGVVWVWHSKSKVLSGGGSECGLIRQKCGMARKHGRGRSVWRVGAVGAVGAVGEGVGTCALALGTGDAVAASGLGGRMVG